MVMYQQQPQQNTNRQMVNHNNPHNPNTYPQKTEKVETEKEYTEADIMTLCDDITSMYFCYEHVNEKLSVSIRPKKKDNGKFHFNRSLSDKYKEIRGKIEEDVADHMGYDVNYEKLPMPTIEKYDLMTVEGHKAYWNLMLQNEKHMKHELAEYANILLKSGYHEFYKCIVKYMNYHKDVIYRIKSTIAYLEVNDWKDWALSHVNKTIHDRIQKHGDFDFSF